MPVRLDSPSRDTVDVVPVTAATAQAATVAASSALRAISRIDSPSSCEPVATVYTLPETSFAASATTPVCTEEVSAPFMIWFDNVPIRSRLCTDQPLDPADIRLSRRLRNQIHDIQPCLSHVTSIAVADELRAWIDLKPQLLRLPIAGHQVQ